MKKLLFILPLLYYSCNDEIISDIDSVLTENAEQDSQIDSLITALNQQQQYIDSLNNVQYIVDSIDNLTMQFYIDSLISEGNISDSLLQIYTDSLNTVQIISDSLNNLYIEAYIDSLNTTQNVLDSIYQAHIDSLININNFDCNGIKGGSAITICNYCIPFESISNNLNMINQDTLLSDCEEYHSSFSETYQDDYNDISIKDYEFMDNNKECNILISAPHSQRTWRYIPEESDSTHGRELYTGAFAKLINKYTGCPAIIKKYKSDDPNYYDTIPNFTKTPAFSTMIGNELPYKKQIKNYLNDNNHIKLVIDLHGWNINTSRISGDIDLGFMNGQSLNSDIGKCLPEIIKYILNDRWLIGTSNNIYSADINQTITKFVSKINNNSIDAIQFEIEKKYRGCHQGNHLNMILALSEIIETLNYLYSLDQSN